MSDFVNKKTDPQFRSGIIAIAGRPNVGKSTLLNTLLAQKISITSRKANTTRHRILGVLNEDCCQYVFVDTPGFATQANKLIDRTIHKVAIASIVGVDLVLFLVESRGWQSQDTSVWKRIQSENLNSVVVLTKIDRVRDKGKLLPIVEHLSKVTGKTDIVPVSAKKNLNIERLKNVIAQYLPVGPPLFPSDFITNQDDVFFASEVIREQVFRYYGKEVPYACAVQIEKYQLEDQVLHLHALIWMESEGQKRIIIGSEGSKLKQLGTRVRQVLELRLKRKVFVKLWVKVRTRWTENPQLIANFGYAVED